MSALFPIETNEESPVPSDSARFMTAIPSAPDCDMNPIRPSRGLTLANVPFRRTCGSVLTMPMQLGPISRIPDDRQMSTSSAWRWPPSGPASPNPAEITTIEWTALSPHARATSTTCDAGTATNARSTGPGISSTVGNDVTPWTAAAFGFTGWTTPSNGSASRFLRSRPPIEVVSRDAPITAIDCGSRKLRTAVAAASRSRSSYCSMVPGASAVGNSTATAPG